MTDTQPDDRLPSPERPSNALLYVLLIGAVILIATALYAASLYQEAATWRRAAEQLTVGQEMLRFDRDEILQKARESEGSLSALEAAREQDLARLEGLETQRRRLQGEVLRLTEALARRERRTEGAETRDAPLEMVDRLERERDRLARELEARRADLVRLESAVRDDDQVRAKRIESLEAQLDAATEEKVAFERNLDALERQLAERRHGERLRQVVRGHRASLGDVQPYIAEVGSEDWSVIESWLALQLRRPMPVPDLSDHGWSYEGARLLGVSDGPPMAMLLYEDEQGRPVSLTIASDDKGERALEAGENGRLRLLDWRDERHAFILAGEADEEVLGAVARDLQNRPTRADGDATVPVSRYIRPQFRPITGP